MACSLPPEILDLIVDHLRDKPSALKKCCVLSKSWVPRTRRYLFAHIRFHYTERSIKLWKLAFPDPSNSLAHHARTLFLCEQNLSTLADPDVGCWIRTFYRVESLHVNALGRNHGFSFVQFHGFSPTLRSLTLTHTSTPLQEIFNLICSFPLLEDLGLTTIVPKGDTDGWNIPSTSPKLTGYLKIKGGLRSVVRRLCDLPSGLHFSKIRVSHDNEEPTLATDLVSRCSDTLKYLTISHYASDVSRMPSLDLSKATSLTHVVFRCGRSTQWVTTTVKTAKSKNLRRITVNSFAINMTLIEGAVYREWEDLDHLLNQLWTSRSIRPRVIYRRGAGEDGDLASRSLPKLTKRGVVDMVEYKCRSERR